LIIAMREIEFPCVLMKFTFAFSASISSSDVNKRLFQNAKIVCFTAVLKILKSEHL